VVLDSEVHDDWVVLVRAGLAWVAHVPQVQLWAPVKRFHPTNPLLCCRQRHLREGGVVAWMVVHQRVQKVAPQMAQKEDLKEGYLEVRPGALTTGLDSEVRVLEARVKEALVRGVLGVNLRHSSPLHPGCQGQP
tara:strand:+ start:4540 stop:4941 length:402 start_codon:yes stop_codon:yes gene_type:complete